MSNLEEPKGFSNDDLDLLAYLLAEEGVELEERPVIAQRAAGVSVPLSFAQQRLWFLDQLQPGATVYNLPTAMRVRGRLDVGALEKTFGEIVRRHEILRTTFVTVDGEPQQIVAPPCAVSFPVINISQLALHEHEVEIERLIREEVARPFDLSDGPLLRTLLIRVSDEEHVVVITTHHIISDGWSGMVLVREIGALYDEFATGRPSGLGELPLQYGDYAIWQREQMQELQAQLDYWRGQLSNLEVLELPFDRPRPAVQTFRGAKQTGLIQREVADRVGELAREEEATLFMIVLAAFAVLLSRYTAQTDIAVGTPVANRQRAELESLIGFFANTLVLRVDTSERTSFRELVRHAREVCLGAYAHQEMPFEKLVEELRPERDLSHTPIFQTLLVLQNIPRGALDVEGLRMERLAADVGSAKFDLTLVIEEYDEGLRHTFEYNTDLFDAATIERMSAHFQRVVEAIAADPEGRLSELALLSATERQQIVVEWNDTPKQYQNDKCIHQLIEEQVARTPDAVALVFEDQQLTYRQLDERANQLAHYIRPLGAGPDVPVAVVMERSIEMVVALLGTLKAGAAYLPLDPDYPRERLAFMLADAAAPVLLTQCHLAERLPEFTGSIICVDSESECGSTQELRVDVTPTNLAYVIYTSGSTGQPKGVMIPHRGISNRLQWMQDAYRLTASDAVLQKTSYSFDVSVWEFFWPLMTGARLVVARPGGHQDPAYLVKLISEQQITTLHFVPPMLKLFLEEPHLETCTSLRRVICSGEALTNELQELFFQRSDAELHNLYGPTEASVDVSFWQCQPEVIKRTVPIGRPIANTQLYILDTSGEPVPIGIAGELHIGGLGLARGYLNRPTLTAEHFIPDPFSGEPGTSLYKTGDLARYWPDRNIEFLGRLDHQVKVRGFRIELPEIEAVLATHAAVQNCIVMVREDAANEKRLVAYVVANDINEIELRNYLKDRLPEYMIPAVFMLLTELPLTANGKIDRRALPPAGNDRPGSDDSYTPPRNETEEALAAIWANALRLDRVGIHDNFFALGGDSILSVRVLAMARERGLDFSLQQLFQYQTVAALTAQLNKSPIDEPADQPTGPFSLITAADRAKLPHDVEDAYPLAMLQAGMLYHIAYSPGEMIYHNVYGYHLRAPLDIAHFRSAVQNVVARHPVLRTSFDLIGYSEPLQLVRTTAIFPVDVDDVRHVPAETQEAILDDFIENEKRRQFDYSQPPLLRLHIHRRTDDSFNLTLTEYHPIFDGWSLYSLLAEIFTSYFAALNNKPVPAPPPLSSSYREFVRRERLALTSDECRRYWDSKLLDIRPTELPRWPTVATQPGDARILKLSYPLSPETSKGLKQVGRSLGLPLKSVLLTAHLKVLSIICGQSDIVTGLVSNGRPEETDGDKIIGLFFNTLPFHAKLSAGSWRELIQATFRSELELVPYRRYPVAALQKQWGRKSLFDTVFNYLHFHVLDELAKSGDLELLGPTRHWEETNLALSTSFVLPPLSDTIVLTLRFDTTQFGRDQIDSISGYYTRVLEAIVAGVDHRHETQDFLASDELQRVLSDWNHSPSAPVEVRCIHEVIEEQAERTPDALAVVHEDEQLTYKQLNERANRLANKLREKSVGPEVPVVLCLERSVETVIAILGVMKAGGAYVPVEPGHPPQRIALMIAEVNAPVLLTQQKLISKLPAVDATVLCVDEDTASELRPNSNVSPANLAYLMFTSGSTGKPKAVAVEHRHLFNYARGVAERLELPAGASYALASTFATDLGHTAIFPALMSGSTLHVLSTQKLADPEALAEYCAQHRIDCLKIVPTHLAALLANSSTGQILPRQRLVLGGDVCHWELVEKVQRLSPDCVVFNHYGPTETTVGVLSHRLDNDRQENGARSVPLGRPLPGAEIYLLDSDLNPVPTGTPGELYIGGKGVTRGYFNQPVLTAEQFIPHPFSRDRGGRLYKTGDIVRYLPDGNVEFLGRKDSQVKVRGYRVELGEIEAVLQQHPSVTRAVATFDGDEHNKQIVAYVVANAGPPPTQNELRGYLREKLPDYAVPSSIVLLDKELPVTSTGKIDRSALPRPAGSARGSDVAYVAPRDKIEQTIATIWRDLLKVERMSIHDNFFDLGGHSLVVLQVQSKLRHVLQRDIPIVDMFEHPTVSSLAQYINSLAPEANVFAKAHEEAAARRAALAQRNRLKTKAAHR